MKDTGSRFTQWQTITIRTKLVASAIAVACMFLVFGTVAFHGMTRIHESVIEEQNQLRHSQLISDMNREMMNVRIDLLYYEAAAS